MGGWLWFEAGAPSGAKEAAEKGIHSIRTQDKHPAGAEAHVDFAALAARLKSCPDTKHSTSGYKVSLERLKIHSVQVQGDAPVVDADGDISVQ
jgi:hypothetical protein